MLKLGEFSGTCPLIAQLTINLRQKIVRLRRRRVSVDCREEFSFCFFGFVLGLVAFPKQNVHLRHIWLASLRYKQEAYGFREALIPHSDVSQVQIREGIVWVFIPGVLKGLLCK